MSPPSPTYQEVHETLTSFPPPLLPPGHSHSPELTATIAALQIHPTIEAALHILNHDLPSAHFLVRHMQSPPAVEGMLLHGILHRIEGDYDNARAWYTDVRRDQDGKELLSKVWSEISDKNGPLTFIDDIEEANKNRGGDDVAELGEKSRAEISGVLKWCVDKFGTEAWLDASSAWVRPDEKIKQMGQDQTTGGKGFRKF